MSDNASNRNALLALVAVVAIAAVAVGYLLGRSGSSVAATAEDGPPVRALVTPEPSSQPLEPAAAGEPLAEAAPAPAAPGPGNLRAGARRVVAPAAREEDPYEPVAGDEIRPEPPPVPEPEPAPIEVTVPRGSPVVLELVEAVSSQSAAVGQEVRARVAEPIRVDGRTAIPAGSLVSGRVTEVRALRKVGGRAHLALAFERVELAGGEAPLEAYWARSGKSETAKDAATIAAGAVIGTVLGNQAKKNDRGKAIGAVVGAGVGTAVAAATEGETVELAPGDRLELTLRSPIPLLLEP